MPNAWNSLIGSGPQPGSVQTAPDTVFPVTVAIAFRKTSMPAGSVGYGGAAAVTTLSANVTRVGAPPNGPTATRPSVRKSSTVTSVTRPLAVVPCSPSIRALSPKPNCTPLSCAKEQVVAPGTISPMRAFSSSRIAACTATTPNTNPHGSGPLTVSPEIL